MTAIEVEVGESWNRRGSLRLQCLLERALVPTKLTSCVIRTQEVVQQKMSDEGRQ